MPEIRLSNSYRRKAKKFFAKHPELLGKYKSITLLLRDDPYHPQLRLHRLQGSLSHLYAVRLTYAYRISLEFEIKEDQIILINIGSHKEVY